MKKITFFLILLFLGIAFDANAVSVSVTLPNGAECLTVGQSYTVTVTLSGDTDHAALYYKTDGTQPAAAAGGGNIDSSAIKHPLTQTTFDWTPSSGDISETGRIWVEAHNNNHNSTNVWDQSNANFAVRASCAAATTVVRKGPVILTAPQSFETPAEFINVIPSFYSARFQFKSPWEREMYRIRLYEDSGGIIQSVDFQDRIVDNGEIIEFAVNGLNPDTLYDAKYFIAAYEFTHGFDSVASKPSVPFRTLSDRPPLTVTSAFGVAGSNGVILSWVNPVDINFSRVLVVRRTDRFAENPQEEAFLIAVSRDGRYAYDDDAKNDVTYYYSIFSQNGLGLSVGPIRILLTPRKDLPSVPLPQIATATTTTFRVARLSLDPRPTSTILQWKNPVEEDFLGVQIVRNELALPAGPHDGQVIFRGRSEEFEDKGLEPAKKYFYGIFPFAWQGEFSTHPSFTSAATLLPEISKGPVGETATSTMTDSTITPIVEEKKDVAVTLEKMTAQLKEVQRKILELTMPLGISNEGEEKKRLVVTKTLRFGMRDEEVYILQEWLAQDAILYPEGLRTGYFGPLTQLAVQRFQWQYGIISEGTQRDTGLGIVGPKTRAKLNAFLDAASNQKEIPGVVLRVSPVEKQNIVFIDENGFSSQQLNISAGDTIRWINNTQNLSWPATDPHPIHTGYPEGGGCFQSAFDACRGIKPGESYTFIFTEKGSWDYHDHLFVRKRGRIIVK
ncbi:MAG: peptidoglycan-binding protein [Patescibacteria group bacterium]